MSEEIREQEVPEQAEAQSLEEAFAALDALAEKLEDRTLPLEESLALYKEGMALLSVCNQKIDRVEKKILQLNEDGALTEFE